MRFVCLTILLMNVGLIVAAFVTWDGRRTMFGVPLGVDYSCFHAAGLLLDRGQAERLYDLDLQDKVHRELHPATLSFERMPFVNPPFFALLFWPLAKLPYSVAYGVWLALTVALFAGGWWLSLRGTPGLSRRDRSMAWLLALSFEPFIVECCIGGQSSAFGFFWIALALDCERRRQPFAAGLAWGMCLYKPTFLLLVVPMCLVTRRWRQLAGFVVTSLALAAVSWATVSAVGCREYSRLALEFLHQSAGTRSVFRHAKYVDLVSAFRLWAGETLSAVDLLLLASLSGALLVALIHAWWRNTDGETDSSSTNEWLWAATLTATMVVNVHMAIYDTLPVLLSLLLIARNATPLRLPEGSLRRLLAAVYLAPWVSVIAAERFGFQAMSWVLVGLCLFLLFACHRPPARE